MYNSSCEGRPCPKSITRLMWTSLREHINRFLKAWRIVSQTNRSHEVVDVPNKHDGSDEKYWCPAGRVLSLHDDLVTNVSQMHDGPSGNTNKHDSSWKAWRSRDSVSQKHDGPLMRSITASQKHDGSSGYLVADRNIVPNKHAWSWKAWRSRARCIPKHDGPAHEKHDGLMTDVSQKHDGPSGDLVANRS